MRRIPLWMALAGCATVPSPGAEPRPPAYSEACADPASPCALSYDFEPSGVAADPFGEPGAFLVANEDGAIFRWDLAPKASWEHDHAELVAAVAPALHKVESATSGRCDGVPVFLAATNFMPGRKGRKPVRERVGAIVGSLEARPRVLEGASAAILGLSTPEAPAKVEGIALSADCKTLFVGLRSRHPNGEERFSREVFPLALDVDWAGGARDAAKAGAPLSIDGPGCSGSDEGVSDLALLPDGSLLVSTSYEKTVKPRASPVEPPRGELAGTLWRRTPDGKVSRLACFPGHKPEAIAVMPDARSVRVIFEDDDYDGRPIRAFAVSVPLP